MNDQNSSQNSDNKDSGGKKPRKQKPLPDDGFDWRRASRTITLWILLVVVTWIVLRQLNLNEKPEAHKSYTQFLKLVESGQIDGAEVIEREFHGKLKDGGAIVTTLPFIDQQMLAQWDSLKIDYQFREKTTSWLGILLTTFLPWIVFIAIWIYFMRRMQGGGGSRGVFSFGKSKAKLSMEGKTKVTFANVAGCDEAKEELQEIISFLRDPKKFTRLGGHIPKGALLLGPPGTGKTLLARAVAGEAEVPFFSMSGADFVEMFVGVGAARVRDLFETGKKHAPCIIFIDEIDAVGRHRGAGLGGGHDEREQTLNQLLVEMDGFEGAEGVILIAATNRPDVLDPALTRPGRFDRQIVVDRPDVRGREGILKVHAKDIPLASDVKLDVLAKGTPGLAGADLANLMNEAALLAARRNANQVFMIDFENAKDKVMMGTERKSMLINEDEKRQTAYHEAGHVLVAKMTPGADPVHKVTIIPRGRALGLTHYLPLDEKHNYSRNYLRQTLTHLLGGRVAERIVFNELSTGAGNDIERATDIARRMVCEWGMSDRMGPIAFGKKQEEIFLGREISQHRDFSERTAQEIDSEVRRIVTDAERNAERIIREHLDKLKVLADVLLEREILDGEEIDVLLKGGKLPPLQSRTADAPPASSQGDNRNQQRRDGRPNNNNNNQRRRDNNFGRRDNRPDQPRGDQQRGDQPRSDQPRQDQFRNDNRRPNQPRSDAPVAEIVRPDPRPPLTTQGDSIKAAPKPAEAPRANEQNRGDRPPRPAGDQGRSNPGKMRRDFARSYGVASSRDPENRRPTPAEIARMVEKNQRQDQKPKSDAPAPIREEARPKHREETRSSASPQNRDAEKPQVITAPQGDSQAPTTPTVAGEKKIGFVRTQRGRRPERSPRTAPNADSSTENTGVPASVNAPSTTETAVAGEPPRPRVRVHRSRSTARPRTNSAEGPNGESRPPSSSNDAPRSDDRPDRTPESGE